jgi:hypothetical protein
MGEKRKWVREMCYCTAVMVRWRWGGTPSSHPHHLPMALGALMWFFVALSSIEHISRFPVEIVTYGKNQKSCQSTQVTLETSLAA